MIKIPNSAPNILFNVFGVDPIKFKALVNLLVNTSSQVIVVVSPKMKKMRKSFLDLIYTIAGLRDNIQLYFTHHHDVDEVVLGLAKETQSVVISNDRYRQKCYDKFRGIGITIRKFRIKNYSSPKLILNKARYFQ